MYLVTGANGQLGTELSKILPDDTIYTDEKELDITKERDVFDFVDKYTPDAIINCAAYTNVDAAEENPKIAKRINVDGVRNLARTKLNLVHISTDYVFDGTGHEPYSPSDAPNPLSVYGKTKLDGEKTAIRNGKNVVIIRTAWLYSPYGNNFVKTMQRLGAQRETVHVVYDQIGTPTYAADLATAIAKILPQINKYNRGIYHFTNAGVCSWYDFAHKIMELSNLSCHVNPIRSYQYPTRAPRPSYSVLDKDKIKQIFDVETCHWEDALKRCIERMKFDCVAQKTKG